jgi:hypothetical protein
VEDHGTAPWITLKTSLTIIVKVAIEKVQFSTLATVCSLLFPTDSLFYSSFFFSKKK